MNYELSDNYEAMYHGAVNGGIQYLLKHKSIKAMIIGVSGGIDSAIACVLARAVCDSLTDRKVVLIGRSLSIESNKEDEIGRAKEIGKTFCDGFLHQDLTSEWQYLVTAVDSIVATVDSGSVDSRKHKIRAGNIKARFRMIYLYNLASMYNGFVLSTDNLTEYMLGFWTLHGDVGDFGFTQNLWKTEVYGLSKWWADNIPNYNEPSHFAKTTNITDCINAVPTDGLGITDSDLDQLLPCVDTPLGWSDGDYQKGYREVDNILIKHLTSQHDSNPPSGPIIGRHLRTQFKRNNPASIDRNLLIPQKEG